MRLAEEPQGVHRVIITANSPADGHRLDQLRASRRTPGSAPRTRHDELPAFTQERITACQLLVRRIDIADDTTVVITAIREHGTDHTKWTVHVNRVWDQEDPTLTAVIDRALHETQAQAGC